ncbi:TA system VapC family ribonuclease toxin [Actinomyces procaprae]|uniref:TA system VapC family ribonuclease toxin n=1 Tax=Actinomyces procaprae TaxID=2560010 RepID=UPI00109DC39D|nr:TA system VapC family ribonuclease toxin [Actinomyces procaprae]
MSTVLLDANLLIALNFPDHEHHELARSWLLSLTSSDSFATDPVTEGALTRYSIRTGLPGTAVRSAIDALHRHPRWRFWADAISYSDVSLAGVRGHKQVTDTYLAALARHYRGHVLTLDRPFAARCNDVVVLLAAPA